MPETSLFIYVAKILPIRARERCPFMDGCRQRNWARRLEGLHEIGKPGVDGMPQHLACKDGFVGIGNVHVTGLRSTLGYVR